MLEDKSIGVGDLKYDVSVSVRSPSGISFGDAMPTAASQTRTTVPFEGNPQHRTVSLLAFSF
ncbi:MAG: hypothetical protein ACRC8K_15485 [Waterburya sp.]